MPQEWVDALTEKMAFSDPYHLGTPIGQLTQLTVLSLPPPYPHKEEEEEVFIEKADFNKDILSAAAKMNCSGEEGIIKYVEETYGCILEYRDADGNRKAGYIVKGVI